VPGGLSNYLGRFFTQFYIYSLMSASIIVMLLFSIQQLLFLITKKINRDKNTYNSSFYSHVYFYPSIFYLYLLCDENTQTGGIIALILALLFVISVLYIKHEYLRTIYFILMIPVFYFICGGVVSLSVILVLIYEFIYAKNKLYYQCESSKNHIKYDENYSDLCEASDEQKKPPVLLYGCPDHIDYVPYDLYETSYKSYYASYDLYDISYNPYYASYDLFEISNKLYEASKSSSGHQNKQNRDSYNDVQRPVNQHKYSPLRNNSMIHLLFLSLISIGLVVALPFAAKTMLMQYPISRYWWGVDYLHFVGYQPFLIIYLWALIIVTIIANRYIKLSNKTNRKWGFLINISMLSIIFYFGIIRLGYENNESKEELMKYDYYCRMKDWNMIVDMADKKNPKTPMTVTCLNLALYKTGKMPDRMFDFYQNGTEGLLPSFQRDFMIATVSGEPYYYLGFVNTAQRLAFEAIESLPDAQKSVRSVKRLVETNIINEKYERALKYINLLRNTIFYRKFAENAYTYLFDEAKINSHPEWGIIKKFRTNYDFLFSEKEKDMMLGIMFEQHKDNRMVYEYLMSYTLLKKEVRNIPLYFSLKRDFEYSVIPKSYQEALLYNWGLTGKSFDSIPYNINDKIRKQVEAYAKIYTSIKNPEQYLKKDFSNTYLYYFHFNKFGNSGSEERYQY
jgi:hypothetical protein